MFFYVFGSGSSLGMGVCMSNLGVRSFVLGGGGGVLCCVCVLFLTSLYVFVFF